jgi:hypothetical protein
MREPAASLGLTGTEYVPRCFADCDLDRDARSRRFSVSVARSNPEPLSDDASSNNLVF